MVRILLIFLQNLVMNSKLYIFHLGIPGCGGLLTGPGGTLSSPNHPDTYEHNLDCEWVIRATRNERVRLTFTALSIEASRNCRFDYVEVKFICLHLLLVHEQVLKSVNNRSGKEAHRKVHWSAVIATAICPCQFFHKEISSSCVSALTLASHQVVSVLVSKPVNDEIHPFSSTSLTPDFKIK